MPTITRAERLAELDAHNAKLLIRIAKETEVADTPLVGPPGSTAAGHEDRLRGWPCVGAPGVGGVQRGSKPGSSREHTAHANATALIGGRQPKH